MDSHVQIVLANGSISNVNYESQPDLYWALRGGAGNFGIVTRFDLEAFEQGPVWGGLDSYVVTDIRSRLPKLNISRSFSFSLNYLIHQASQLGSRLAGLLGRSTTSEAVLQAFEDMMLKEKGDKSYLQYFFSFVYFPRTDLHMASVMYVRDAPGGKVDDNPPALSDPKAMQGKPLYSSASVKSLRTVVTELDPYNPEGYRYHAILNPPAFEL
jgi:hypothetical protein